MSILSTCICDLQRDDKTCNGDHRNTFNDGLWLYWDDLVQSMMDVEGTKKKTIMFKVIGVKSLL